MFKRIISMLLVAVMLVSAAFLVACSGDEESSTAQGDVSKSIDAGFLAGNKNWNGTTVTVLTHNLSDYSTAAFAHEESEIAEPVAEAFLNRNRYIEEKYGIKIRATYVDKLDGMIERVRLEANSQTGEFQAVKGGIMYMSTLGVEGMLHDFNNIGNDYIHLDQAWWDQALIRDLTLSGKLWFLAGDAIVDDDEATWALYFNKGLVKTNNLEDPYQLVKDGNWTLDTMYEMAKKVHKMNGSTMSYDPAVGDVWGIVAQSYDSYMFMAGAGQPLVDNSGEKPVFRIMNERNISVFQKLHNILHDKENVGIADFFGRWDSGVYDQEATIFSNGNALFMPGSISTVSSDKMKNAEIEYGILPMPKADTTQEDYTTSETVYWCGVLSIPSFIKGEELDATCFALEAMAYYGKEMVTPEYYERTLTYKRFKDDDSRDMLDLIFRNRTYDLGTVFDFSTGAAGSGSLYFYTTLLSDESGNIASLYEQKQQSFESALQNLIDECWN